METDNATSFIDRSQSAAHEAVREASTDITSNLEDARVSEALSGEFIDEVFRLAWRHQFEDNRRTVTRDLRELFRDRVSEVFSKEIPE